jgi:hypothetical protein
MSFPRAHLSENSGMVAFGPGHGRTVGFIVGTLRREYLKAQKMRYPDNSIASKPDSTAESQHVAEIEARGD